MRVDGAVVVGFPSSNFRFGLYSMDYYVLRTLGTHSSHSWYRTKRGWSEDRTSDAHFLEWI